MYVLCLFLKLAVIIKVLLSPTGSMVLKTLPLLLTILSSVAAVVVLFKVEEPFVSLYISAD